LEKKKRNRGRKGGFYIALRSRFEVSGPGLITQNNRLLDRIQRASPSTPDPHCNCKHCRTGNKQCIGEGRMVEEVSVSEEQKTAGKKEAHKVDL
jgi:hypothetical protein